MKNLLWSVIVIIYIAVAITVTFCLLNYNENKITEFGDNSLIIISDDEMQPDYSNGDLVIANKKSVENVKKGEKIFFYVDDKIKCGEVQDVHSYAGVSSTFIMDGDYQVLEDDVIGSASTAKVFGKVGKILSILESKWGFLFLIIFPSVLAFLNEIAQVVTELKGGNDDRDDDRYERIDRRERDVRDVRERNRGERPEYAQRPERRERPIRDERDNREIRRERTERGERMAREERIERNDRIERHPRPQRPRYTDESQEEE